MNNENTSKQPVSNIQWLDSRLLLSNLYNPNNVASPELELLKTSINEDGWVFPILVLDKSIHIEGLTENKGLDKYTIIDGFHRHKVSPSINQGLGYLVPCVILSPENPVATTVRMNRAKGTHAVIKMSDIIAREILAGKDIDYIMKAYGMEKEEVVRLGMSAGIPHSELIKKSSYGKSWVPK